MGAYRETTIDTNCPYCGWVIRQNGNTLIPHLKLAHKFSRGETLLICLSCAAHSELIYPLTGPYGNWNISETVKPEKP